MRFRAQDAFTLVELLMAMGIMLVVTAGVFATLDPAREIFQVQPEVHDLQQRLRVAVEALQKPLIMGGAGVYTGSLAGPLHHYIAPIRPYRVGESGGDAPAGVFYRPDTVSVLYVPATVAQAGVERVRLEGNLLVVDVAANCGPAVLDRVCGFERGMRVLLFDRTGRAEIGTVERADGRAVYLEGSGLRGVVDPRGAAMLTEVSMETYFTGIERATGTPRLMRYDGRRTDLPLVDHVVGLRFDYFVEPAPPAVLPDVDLAAIDGPFTTYGPAPPPLGRDNPADIWGPGENCAFAVLDGRHIPRLASLGNDSALVAIDPAMLVDGPWCADPIDPDRFDADLLRVRRVRVTLRVEAAADSLRGPVGPAFVRGGSARSARRLVADQELQFDVIPRNLSLPR